MPPARPVISDAESQVMDILWQASPLTSEEIVVRLGHANDWHEKTIRTLLNRLLGKGVIQAERDGRRYLYHPVLTREQWQSQESRSLLDRVFGGRVAPLLAHFSTHEKLSKRDIAELRKLIDDIERKER